MSKASKQAAAKIAVEDNFVSKLIPLFWEINNLKRIRAAEISGSLAENLFRQAWSRIVSGVDVRAVATQITAQAVVAAQLGAIDAKVLRNANLSQNEIEEIIARSFAASTVSLDEDLKQELRRAISTENSDSETDGNLHFVELLASQPRSGATKIGAPKLVFDRPENHAEHCAGVAILAVLLAPLFDADRAAVFLMSLAHHFHNAYLPDSGFAGEEMLGAHLPKIFLAFREKCLAELPENLAERVRKTFPSLEAADAPESKAFHAADVLDRVLQMRHHAEANRFTLQFALEEMELVHEGAVQQFHYEILRRAKIIE